MKHVYIIVHNNQQILHKDGKFYFNCSNIDDIYFIKTKQEAYDNLAKLSKNHQYLKFKEVEVYHNLFMHISEDEENLPSYNSFKDIFSTEGEEDRGNHFLLSEKPLNENALPAPQSLYFSEYNCILNYSSFWNKLFKKAFDVTEINFNYNYNISLDSYEKEYSIHLSLNPNEFYLYMDTKNASINEKDLFEQTTKKLESLSNEINFLVDLRTSNYSKGLILGERGKKSFSKRMENINASIRTLEAKKEKIKQYYQQK